MTRKETNRKISELRGWRAAQCVHQPWLWFLLSQNQQAAMMGQSSSSSEDEAWKSGPDWHSDALWPTLLRELPFPILEKRECEQGAAGYCWRLEGSADRNHLQDPADAVLDAWIRWKEGTK